MSEHTGRVLPHEILDRFTWEVAAQEGLTQRIRDQGWGELSARECGRVGGRIGGRMVRVMIRNAEKALMESGAQR